MMKNKGKKKLNTHKMWHVHMYGSYKSVCFMRNMSLKYICIFIVIKTCLPIFMNWGFSTLSCLFLCYRKLETCFSWHLKVKTHIVYDIPSTPACVHFFYVLSCRLNQNDTFESLSSSRCLIFVRMKLES